MPPGSRTYQAVCETSPDARVSPAERAFTTARVLAALSSASDKAQHLARSRLNPRISATASPVRNELAAQTAAGHDLRHSADVKRARGEAISDGHRPQLGTRASGPARRGVVQARDCAEARRVLAKGDRSCDGLIARALLAYPGRNVCPAIRPECSCLNVVLSPANIQSCIVGL